MEELLAVLVGTGAVVFSPFLIPGLRPVAKSAIKGGMAAADAAKVAAAATAESCRDAVHKATDAVNKAGEALKPAPKAAAQEAPAAEEAPAAAESAGGTAEAAAAAGAGPINLTPIVTAINKAVEPLAGAAVTAVAGALAHASKQWNDLIADAQAERKANEVAAVAEAVKAPAAESAPVPAPKGPVMVAAAAPAVEPAPAAAPEPAAAAVTAPARVPSPAPAAAADELQQVRGIGPKVAGLLRDAGIDTLEQLANADVEQLRGILTNAGARYRVTDPSPWPAEARQLLKARGN